MHIAVLIEKQGWMSRDLQRAAGVLGIDITMARWSDLSASITDDDTSVRAGSVILNHADAVLLRTVRAAPFEQIFFRMDALHRLEAAGVTVVNPPRAVEVSVDKYMALALAREAGLPTPDTAVCQRAGDALAAYDRLGGDVVIKPLFGSEGFGITRITEREMAQRAFTLLERMGSVAYVQRYVEHGHDDIRMFVLGDQVLAAMKRHGSDWRTNIALGAAAEPINPDDSTKDLALRAARSCGALVAGVDILIDENDQPYLLEVNAIPGWRKLAQVTATDVGQRVLDYIAQASR